MKRGPTAEGRRLLLLSLLAAAAMTAVAALVVWLDGRPLLPPSLDAPQPWHMQLLWGTLFAAGAALLLSRVDPPGEFFERVKRAMIRLLRRARLGPAGLALVAACAGIGEELLFREALQPVLGLWIASALFALVHGTFTRPSWSAVAYTGLLFAAGLGLGLLYEWAGLLAAIWAHALYDWIMLLAVHRMGRKA